MIKDNKRQGRLPTNESRKARREMPFVVSLSNHERPLGRPVRLVEALRANEIVLFSE